MGNRLRDESKIRKFAFFISIILLLVLIVSVVNVNGNTNENDTSANKASGVKAPDSQAPSAPSALVVKSSANKTALLTWQPSTDNTGVVTYRIYNGSYLAGTSAAAGYTLSGLSPAEIYSFTVKAVDAAGNVSPASNAVSLKPPAAVVQKSAKVIIGYYSGWSTYSGSDIAELDGSRLTHINYAFAKIGADLKIAVGDSFADLEKKFPGDKVTDRFHGNFNQLLKMKQRHPQLKTFISVGGWAWSGRFSNVALTDYSRSVFADSAVKFIVKYGFDGVDIDWEYPVKGGAPGNAARPADKRNFTLLMQKLREKLDMQERKDGKTYLLSFTGAAGTHYTSNVELSKLQQYSDFINIMSYDVHGTWDALTGLNAPLHNDPHSGIAGDIGVGDAVQLYLKSGVPPAKLVMGVPFYGYKYDHAAKRNKGLNVRFSGGKAVSYSEVVSKYLNKGYTRYFHPQSKVPYLYNGSSFISYDDPQSIGYKAAYIKTKGIAGAMVWTLSQDTADHDLLHALYKGLH